MVRNPIDIWFDFVDPVSVLLMLEIDAARAEGATWSEATHLRWRPRELRPPPASLIGLDHPDVAERWATAASIADKVGARLAPPTLVPWTRKAHELVAHTSDAAPEQADAVRSAIARAYALEGQDIGRVDVLVEIAIAHGLDRTETKAVLDVDRYEPEIASLTAQATEAGVDDIPTIVKDGQRIEGFHNRTALSTLLGT